MGPEMPGVLHQQLEILLHRRSLTLRRLCCVGLLGERRLGANYLREVQMKKRPQPLLTLGRHKVSAIGTIGESINSSSSV